MQEKITDGAREAYEKATGYVLFFSFFFLFFLLLLLGDGC
jgi:hypothetical protein